MDFRMKKFSKLGKFPRAEDGLRVMAARVPQAEALAMSWLAAARPVLARIYVLRRRIATIGVFTLACFLFVHVMFGANGMVVYRQKRAEREALQQQLVRMQQENDRYAQQIQGLKGDQKAIEKEAREQLGYAKPGEIVYVAPAPAQPIPPANRTARK
jgi:cell division protein FtsB